MVICKKCAKEFRPTNKSILLFEKDGMCGRCRSHIKYISEYRLKRKTKPCPKCGKEILDKSSLCGSCSQLGTLNRKYKDGLTGIYRKCTCGKQLSNKSKGLCNNCYQRARFGKDNPNYKHGIYSNKLLNTKNYLEWKLSVYERDNRTCQLCHTNVGHVGNAHHILPKRDRPDLIFALDNGITLCSKCHSSLNGKEYNYVDTFIDILHAKVKLGELGES